MHLLLSLKQFSMLKVDKLIWCFITLPCQCTLCFCPSWCAQCSEHPPATGDTGRNQSGYMERTPWRRLPDLQLPTVCQVRGHYINTLRPRQNRRHFTDDIFKCIFLNENVWIPIKISLKFVPKGAIINIPALVQIMAWCHPGDKPLSEPMVVSLRMHVCVTRLA